MDIMVIKFWRVLDKWGEFSNFYRREVEIDGRKWKSTEHYYQAMKFYPDATITLGTKPPSLQPFEVLLHNYIADQPSPRQAADEGRRRDLPMRPDWNDVKDDFMRNALRAKFSFPDLRNLLLSTGEAGLIEDSPTDYYWGCGRDGSGKNMLGVLLMELRTELFKDWWAVQKAEYVINKGSAVVISDTDLK